MLPSYYIPLTLEGRIALRLGLHRGTGDWIPEPVAAAYRKVRSSGMQKIPCLKMLRPLGHAERQTTQLKRVLRVCQSPRTSTAYLASLTARESITLRVQQIAMPGIVGFITRMPREQAERSFCGWSRPFVTRSSILQGLGSMSHWGVCRMGCAKGFFFRRNATAKRTGRCSPRVFRRGISGAGHAQRLKEQGHEFDVDGPSYLVHLYEEDRSFPAGLNGRFHGLLADRNRGTAMLFNDRYGMHRIYYHESKDAFYFAAEAKAILAVRPELRRMDSRGLGEFVACGAVLENRTLFEGIHVLPPASAWVFRNGSLEQKRQLFPPQGNGKNRKHSTRNPTIGNSGTTFTRNLPRYFAGHEPIGMSLTGGLDTRMILAWQKPEPGSLPCYTFGSMFRDNQDVRVARRVAKFAASPIRSSLPDRNSCRNFRATLSGLCILQMDAWTSAAPPTSI